MLAKYIFSAVILRCPISPGKYDYEPPKHKMPPFSQNNIFFRHFWYFSVTKAIHYYVLAKFEKISVLLFSTKVLQTTTLKILKGTFWLKLLFVLDKEQAVKPLFP